jgi:hypothetical protein
VDAVLARLFDRAERPPAVGVDPRMGVVRLKMPVAGSPDRRLVPGAFGFAGAVGGIVLMSVATSGWPDPCFTSGLLCAVSIPFVVLAMATGGVMGWSAVRANMVGRVELEPHRVVLRGPLENELWAGSLHEIADVWASSDLVSGILGLKVPALLALRVVDDETALWLRDVLRAWQARYGRTANAESQAEMQRLARAMGVAAATSRESE